MIFFLVKWYAILKGVPAGFRKPRRVPMTLAQFDSILKEYYIPQLTAEFNQPNVWLSALEDI